MTVSVFQDWFRKFCDLVADRPLLVILDGHISHLDKGTIELAMQQNITLLKLPPHTTDVLQPLDKCCFGPLKLKWNNALIEWQRLNQRKLSKNEFSDLICKIWHDGLSDQVIKSSFEKTGIYPPNRNRYPVHRLDPQKLYRYKQHIESEDVFQLFEDNILDNVEEPILTQEADTSSRVLTETSNTVSQREEQNSSFETLLLSKIQRTIPNSTHRRKIDASSKVLTTAEFLDEINKKETNKKRGANKKRKEISSSSDEEEQTKIVYEDESDLEGVALEDLITEDDKSIGSDSEMDYQEGLSNGDYILVRFASKTKVVYFVAQIDNVKEDEVDVTYLKRQGNVFIYPKTVEKCVVLKTDIQEKLAPPKLQGGTSRTANQYKFFIEFDKFNVQ